MSSIFIGFLIHLADIMGVLLLCVIMYLLFGFTVKSIMKLFKTIFRKSVDRNN